jgi:UDP-N-acetylmuramoylalanine--D-glutamate ligase
LGGYDKNIPFDELAEPILTRKIKAFITGATADKIMDAITSSKFYNESDAWLIRCDNFEHAVRKACAAALPGDIVLMSPACASFDEFDNFEKRGERFKEIVKSITE